MAEQEPAAIIASDGEVFLIPNLPEDIGNMFLLASMSAFAKFWDTPEEDAAWNHLGDDNANDSRL